jgi:hypothetical protein
VSNDRDTGSLLHLWVFAALYAEKPRFMGCFGSLQGKKSPNRRFFDIFLREAQQTPGANIR